MRNLAVILFIFLLAPVLFSAGMEESVPVPERDLEFRGFRWGAALEDVIKKEGLPEIEEEQDGKLLLGYENTDVSGYTANMGILFDDDGLAMGLYFLELDNPEKANECFNDLLSKLYVLYGNTILTDSFLEIPESRVSVWYFSGGCILLNYDKGGTEVELMYSSIAAFQDLMNLSGL
ncbi:hypothetical protein [Breznakiella homolactica]|uniref:Uncharacterized protein n=1 Tax=Breznakiella homolactica TaxID=2798577 RepID=A0A7T7XKZ4_9SPIR|nr:hypothetical protein [Breznakiella homolactica]QQO08296.1 hypothetical protein JFL75_15350 [Breznakiella homolactica]